MIEIIPETPAMHAEAIETLYDKTFGPGHFAKTAERLREGNLSLPRLTRVAVEDGALIGVCRIWPVEIGDERTPAVFVGPVAVDPAFQGQRLGLSVTGEALEAAALAGWGHAIIIGAPTYFGELGFTVMMPDSLQFPGPQIQSRVMIKTLVEGAGAVSGKISAPVDPERYL